MTKTDSDDLLSKLRNAIDELSKRQEKVDKKFKQAQQLLDKMRERVGDKKEENSI